MPSLRNTALDTSTSSDTDNNRDASSTCISDSFLAVSSHNQSDEDLATSIKYRGVPSASPSQTVDANAFMHEKLMELLIHYDTAHVVMSVFRGESKGNPLLNLPFSKNKQD